MIRLLLTYILIQIGSISPAIADTCAARFTNEREVIIKIETRKVVLLGWEHLDDQTVEILLNGVQAAFGSVQSGNCAQASLSVNDTLSRLNQDLSNARAVFERLDQLHEIHGLDFLGVEMTPRELARQWELTTGIDEKLSALENGCGPELRKLTSDLRLMLPGPEWAFHRKHPAIVIQATEDQVLKDLNGLDFAGEDNFDFDDPAITQAAQSAIETIRNDILALRPPSDEIIDRAVSFEPNPALRAALELELRNSIARGTRIIRGAYKRNEAIAASILRSRGNMAVPIGFRHVDHLVQEILRQCRRDLP